MLRDRITDDLKAAMLAKQAERVSVLRSLKSAMTYAEVAAKTREGLDDAAVLDVLAKESKKRQESADSYTKAALPERAAAELREKQIIEDYLPAMLTDTELQVLVGEAIGRLDEATPKSMGQVISDVKAHAAGRVDGAMLATIVKARLAAS